MPAGFFSISISPSLFSLSAPHYVLLCVRRWRRRGADKTFCKIHRSNQPTPGREHRARNLYSSRRQSECIRREFYLTPFKPSIFRPNRPPGCFFPIAHNKRARLSAAHTPNVRQIGKCQGIFNCADAQNTTLGRGSTL
jgi:hypothetical protein